MGVLEAVMAVPLELHRADGGSAVVGRVGCRVTAGANPVEVRAVTVAVLDAFGAGAHRPAKGVTVPGQLEPQAVVRVRPFTAVEVSVWFEPLALGIAHDCRIVAELLVDGQRVVAAANAVVIDDKPSLAR